MFALNKLGIMKTTLLSLLAFAFALNINAQTQKEYSLQKTVTEKKIQVIPTVDLKVLNKAIAGNSINVFQENSNSLPNEVYKLSAVLDGSVVYVSWVTTNTTSHHYFIVERSEDGITFSEIDRVNSQETISETGDYKITDYSPLKGVNYYRLIQVVYISSDNTIKVLSKL